MPSGIYQGEYGWHMFMTYSMGFFLLLFCIFPQYFMYVLMGFVIYFAGLITIKTNIILRKREEIDGVIWLDSFTVKDLQHSEELLLGVENYRLLDYTLETNTEVELDDLTKKAEKFLEFYDQERNKKFSLGENEEAKIKKEKKEEKEKAEIKKNIKNNTLGKVKSILEKEKIPKKDGKMKQYIEEVCNNPNSMTKKEIELTVKSRGKSKSELKGIYYYLTKFSQQASFSDSENHEFERSIIVTSYPFEIEFTTSRLMLNVQGYSAKARASKCALKIETWLTDDRPLITVEWTESDTLELKARLIKEENNKSPSLEKSIHSITALRGLLNQILNKIERLEITEERLTLEKNSYQELYEDLVQFFMEKSNDYYHDTTYLLQKGSTVMIKKNWGVFLLILIILLLSLVFGFLF